jgi:hypothetical protein
MPNAAEYAAGTYLGSYAKQPSMDPNTYGMGALNNGIGVGGTFASGKVIFPASGSRELDGSIASSKTTVTPGGGARY